MLDTAPSLMRAEERVEFLSRADELVNTGAKFFQNHQLDPARLHFLAALFLDPKHPTALQNLAAALRDMHHYHAAAAAAARSVILTDSENPFCLTNLGVALLGLKRHGKALKILKEAVELLPTAAPSWHNLGLILYIMGRHSDALDAFDKSLSLAYNPHCASDRSMTLLSLGRIADGLASYECRWETLYKNRVWELGIPEWKGEDLTNCRLLVHHEQGFGDSIMLVRFLKQLAEKKCHLTLAVPEPLVRLFQKSFPFISIFSLEDERIGSNSGFDYHSPLLSVMRWIGIKRPDDISSAPYLMSLGPSPMTLPSSKKKIGICWASGNHAPALVDRRRLVPLHLFLPLFDNVDVAIISLQKGEDTKDLIAYGLEGLIFDVSMKLDDFAETANVIDQLDLVISVDSAVCHIAGALGKPCLMLSPYTRCWRWWGLPSGRPWYDHMFAFTQSPDGSWDQAMKAATGRALYLMSNGK